MFEILVTTPWIGAGTEEDTYRPVIAGAFSVASWTDVTGQRCENLEPAPNVFVIKAVVDQATLDAIEAHPDYEILTSEEVVEDETP